MVFRRAAHHAGPTDINVLDDVVTLCPAHHGCLERIKIDHNQVDCADGMLVHRSSMLLIVAYREQAAVHLGVERFHAAIHHLGKAGQLRDIAHRQTGIAQCFGGSPRRNQFDLAPCKSLTQLHQPALVGH